MKNFLYLLIGVFLCGACNTTRTTSAVGHRQKTATHDPQFLDFTMEPSKGAVSRTPKPLLIKSHTHAPGTPVYNIEGCNDLQFKYAILLDEDVETMTNEKMISFLEDWYGIPYKYGGEGKKGVDCSAFTLLFMDSVYGIDLPRTCREQYSGGIKVRKDQLVQGDLVFFNTTGSVSHVGIFLANNKFVHASTSSGVMVSDLDDLYFKKRYAGAVRVR